MKISHPLAVLLLLLSPMPARADEQTVLKDDFSGYSTDTDFNTGNPSNTDDWSFFPLPNSEALALVSAGTESKAYARIRQTNPADGRADWCFFRLFNEPVGIGGNEILEFEASIRCVDSGQSSDLIFGLIGGNFKRIPDNNNFLTFFRFLGIVENNLHQFRYWKSGASPDEGEYVTPASFSIIQNEWYTFRSVFNLKENTLSFQLRNEQGDTVLDVADIPFRRGFESIVGIAFKNRTNDANRSARFDLTDVVIRRIPLQ